MEAYDGGGLLKTTSDEAVACSESFNALTHLVRSCRDVFVTEGAKAFTCRQSLPSVIDALLGLLAATGVLGSDLIWPDRPSVDGLASKWVELCIRRSPGVVGGFGSGLH